MSEKEIIKDRPEEQKKKPKGEHEPNPDRACDHSEMVMISTEKSKIVHCNTLADYRVLEYSDRRYLVDGGDPQDAKSYKALMTETYYCNKHFELKYKFSPPPTPTMTFVRIKR